MRINKLRVLLYVLTASSILSTVLGQALVSSLSVTICGIVHGIQTFVGLLAIGLFLVGGVLYAIAHFIPTSVEFRKSMQGWSTAMIIGGIIGLLVVILAYPLVNLLASFGNAANPTAATQITVGQC